MVKLTNKQYDVLNQLWRDKENGRLLTPDGLRFVCAANDYDAEKIGRHFLEVLGKFNAEGVFADVASPDDIDAIEEARKEFEADETVSHDDINWA